MLVDRFGDLVEVIEAAGRSDTEFGPIARQRLRHVLIGRAQRRALRVKRGIVLIGLNQRPFERVGTRRHDATDGADRRPEHRPPKTYPQCPSPHDADAAQLFPLPYGSTPLRSANQAGSESPHGKIKGLEVKGKPSGRGFVQNH